MMIGLMSVSSELLLLLLLTLLLRFHSITVEAGDTEGGLCRILVVLALSTSLLSRLVRLLVGVGSLGELVVSGFGSKRLALEVDWFHIVVSDQSAHRAFLHILLKGLWDLLDLYEAVQEL